MTTQIWLLDLFLLQVLIWTIILTYQRLIFQVSISRHFRSIIVQLAKWHWSLKPHKKAEILRIEGPEISRVGKASNPVAIILGKYKIGVNGGWWT